MGLGIGRKFQKEKKRLSVRLGLSAPDVRKPVLKEVETAPVPDDPKAKIARMREYQRKYRRAGRQGTMLTEGLDLG